MDLTKQQAYDVLNNIANDYDSLKNIAGLSQAQIEDFLNRCDKVAKETDKFLTDVFHKETLKLINK